MCCVCQYCSLSSEFSLLTSTFPWTRSQGTVVSLLHLCFAKLKSARSLFHPTSSCLSTASFQVQIRYLKARGIPGEDQYLSPSHSYFPLFNAFISVSPLSFKSKSHWQLLVLLRLRIYTRSVLPSIFFHR